MARVERSARGYFCVNRYEHIVLKKKIKKKGYTFTFDSDVEASWELSTLLLRVFLSQLTAGEV